VADPRRLEAVLYVGDVDVDRVRAGQRVRLALNQLPDSIVDGTVREVSRRTVAAGPVMSVGYAADEPLERLFRDLESPGARASYQVRVELTGPLAELVPGTRGQAKIATAEMALVEKLLRIGAQVFRTPGS
jgi:hypothetical protein